LERDAKLSGGVCDTCVVGRYTANTGQPTCLQCPEGITTAAEATESEAGCSTCLAGRFRADSSSNTCDVCGAGQSAATDSVACSACPSGQSQEKGKQLFTINENVLLLSNIVLNIYCFFYSCLLFKHSHFNHVRL
jgi:hypothetical protein